MEKKNILTYEGLRKYEDELHELKVVRRKEVAQKIKEAREQGDLSENAEYDAAKDEQRDIEARIEELEKILKNAEVVVEDEVDLDKINIGCKVKILDVEFASVEPTILYSNSSLNSTSRMITLQPMLILSVSTSSSSTTSAFFKSFSNSSILASISRCSSFAASYSAFSDKSPCSRASLIF